MRGRSQSKYGWNDLKSYTCGPIFRGIQMRLHTCRVAGRIRHIEQPGDMMMCLQTFLKQLADACSAMHTGKRLSALIYYCKQLMLYELTADADCEVKHYITLCIYSCAIHLTATCCWWETGSKRLSRLIAWFPIAFTHTHTHTLSVSLSLSRTQ